MNLSRHSRGFFAAAKHIPFRKTEDEFYHTFEVDTYLSLSEIPSTRPI